MCLVCHSSGWANFASGPWLRHLGGHTDRSLKHVVCLPNTGNNEIDRALLDLLQQNIDAAKQAGQAEPAVFMEKIRDAARKFVLT